MKMEERAQGEMTYMLLVALAVVSALVAGLYLKSLPQQAEHRINAEAQHIIGGF